MAEQQGNSILLVMDQMFLRVVEQNCKGEGKVGQREGLLILRKSQVARTATFQNILDDARDAVYHNGRPSYTMQAFVL